ncbi:beta-defensin 109-like [Glossophaga mutica]
MRHYVLLSTLLFLTLLPPARGGMGPSESVCLNLSGICRKDICKRTEDTIGACRRRWRCCRAWWILIPIPTPAVYSDYQEPRRSKVK